MPESPDMPAPPTMHREAAPSFTCFPNLPLELRLKVWKHCAEEPRIVEVCQRPPDYYTESESFGDPNPNPFYTVARIPSFLHATEESRSAGLQSYILSFPYNEHPATIYYNPKVDTLFFPPWCESGMEYFSTTTPAAVKEKIQSVAMEILEFQGYENNYFNKDMQIKDFKNLQQVFLVWRRMDHLGCLGCLDWESLWEEGLPDFAECEEDPEKETLCNQSFKKVALMLQDIADADSTWHMPKLTAVSLKIDGVFT